ncbi:alpha/beta fold hydrolase [Myxococcota bacterium]|nr:alpha/beta fold hydrolase [Myxococcota bacterium]
MEVFGLHGFLGQPSDWRFVEEDLRQTMPWVRWQSPSCWPTQKDTSKSPSEQTRCLDTNGQVEQARCLDTNGQVEQARCLDATGQIEQTQSLRAWARRFCQEVAQSTQEARILVGYSMGGRLALHALLEQPDLWAGAMIISAHYGLRDQAAREARKQHDAQWAARFRTMDWDALMQAWDQQSVFGGQADQRPLRQESDFDRESLARALEVWSLGNQDYLLPALYDVRHKLCWLVGAEDTKFCQLTEEAAFLAQGIRTLRMEGLGHRLPWQDPSRFLDVLHHTISEMR